MRELAPVTALVAVGLGAAGCDSAPAAPPAGPVPGDAQGDVVPDGPEAASDAPGEEAASDAGDSGPVYALCVDAGLDASFQAIYTHVLATTGCGVQSVVCHSTVGAGRGRSLLDFSLDASAVYAELLGDGGGEPATNCCGDAGGVLLRVVPHDAGASFLYIKLTLTQTDPRYGEGMPLYTPGSVCPPTLDAIKTWIEEGAQPN